MWSKCFYYEEIANSSEIDYTISTDMATQNFSLRIPKPICIVNQYSRPSTIFMDFTIPKIRIPIEPFRFSFFHHSPLPLRTSKVSGMIPESRSSGAVIARAGTESSIYDFTVKDIDQKDVSLSEFKGKVILIVNVASKCGLTTSNYSELSGIYNKYKPQGFEILAFPCNQFGGQEPASNPEIKEFACSRFKAEFPIFDKIDVNGSNTAPVYQFLKSSSGGLLGGVIKWNFEKFLLDRNGKIYKRYPPTTSPHQIEKDIEKLLG